jgi:hypothetical protein
LFSLPYLLSRLIELPFSLCCSFTWERVIIDECHETLVTSKDFKTKDDYKEAQRQACREFLGVAQTDISKRPLLAATGVWGLTGTPLLSSEARVCELANLCNHTYLTGACSHWRKDERYSNRDLFLSQIEGTKSRDYRIAVQDAAHCYVETACQRNRGEELSVSLQRVQRDVNMSEAEGSEYMAYVSKAGYSTFSVVADNLGENTEEVVELSASSKARHEALIDTICSIQEKEPTTKIIVFATTAGGYASALEGLKKSDIAFCNVSNERDSVERQNEIISWFRHEDATEEDRKRPRVLLLSFEQAAGHNLQAACHNCILYDRK